MLRIVLWATGSVGRHAVAAVHHHPDLELVGALVYSDAKAGRDVGEIGLAATKDRDEIIAIDADCVLYMPQGEMNPMGAVGDICALLASGKNHAIAPLCAAAPGIRTFLELPTSVGRGVLTG